MAEAVADSQVADSQVAVAVQEGQGKAVPRFPLVFAFLAAVGATAVAGAAAALPM